MSQPDENDDVPWTCMYCGEPHKGRGCELPPTVPLTREQLRALEKRLAAIHEDEKRLKAETEAAVKATAVPADGRERGKRSS